MGPGSQYFWNAPSPVILIELKFTTTDKPLCSALRFLIILQLPSQEVINSVIQGCNGPSIVNTKTIFPYCNSVIWAHRIFFFHQPLQVSHYSLFYGCVVFESLRGVEQLPIYVLDISECERKMSIWLSEKKSCGLGIWVLKFPFEF